MFRVPAVLLLRKFWTIGTESYWREQSRPLALPSVLPGVPPQRVSRVVSEGGCGLPAYRKQVARTGSSLQSHIDWVVDGSRSIGTTSPK